MTLHLLLRERVAGTALAEAMNVAIRDVGQCRLCRNLTELEVCALCRDERRDSGRDLSNGSRKRRDFFDIDTGCLVWARHDLFLCV